MMVVETDNNKVVYSWEYVGLKDSWSNLERWVFSILTLAIPLLIISLMSLNALKYFASIFIPLMFFARYFIMPDCKINYVVLKGSLYYESTQLISESAYKTVRVIAWAGIALSLIAVFIVGIGALAGAGASALMGFKLTNFRSKTDKQEFKFSENATVFDIDNRSPIKFRYKDFNERYMIRLVSFGAEGGFFARDLFFSDEHQKQTVIQELSRLFNKFEVVSVTTVDDCIKNAKYREILDNRPD